MQGVGFSNSKGATITFAFGLLIAVLSSYGTELLSHDHPLRSISLTSFLALAPGSVIPAVHYGFLSTSFPDHLVRAYANGVIYSLSCLGALMLPNGTYSKRAVYFAFCLGTWIAYLLVRG